MPHRYRPASLVPTLAFALTLGGVLGLVPGQSAHAQANSRSQAIEQAMSRAGGRGQVLSVREIREGGSSYYDVKILTDGRVRVYRIPARR